MKFLKGLLHTVSVVAFAVSATVFMLSYPIISSVSPSLVMDALKTAGGVEKVVGEILEREMPRVPVSKENQRAIMAAAKATLTEDMIRDLTSQVISGFKRYLDSVGTEGAVLLNLRSLKDSFFGELKKAYPQAVDEIEELMEDVPDTANIAGVIPIETVRGIARPYKIATNIPVIAVTVAAASLLLTCLASGFLPGLRTVGWTLLIMSILILGASSAGAGWVGKQLLRLLGDTGIGGLPIEVDMAAIVDGVTGFVLARVRLTGGVCAACGGALALVPGALKRRAVPDQPTS